MREVVGIGRHDPMLAGACAQHYGGVDDVRRAANAAELPGGTCTVVIEHVDLVVIRAGEKVKVDVAVHVVGDAAPDTMVALDLQAIEVEVAATAIPELIEVSVQGAEAGTQVLASQVTLPEGATLVTDPDALVINVTTAITSEALEAELDEAEAEAGIEHEAPSSPADGAEAAEAPAGEE